MTQTRGMSPGLRRTFRMHRNKLRILELLDPDWEQEFEDFESAWEFYYDHSPDEIMRFAAEEGIDKDELM